MYESAIFLFNRDLRIQDNECLLNAVTSCKIVYPIFIFTPEQVINNKYINYRSISFMAESLLELAGQLPLCFFQGPTINILEKLIKSHKIKAIYNNIDVTPYAIKRSKKIKDLCKKYNIDFVQGDDVFMGRHTKLTKSNGQPYLKFTPFYNNAVSKINHEQVIKFRHTNMHPISSRNTNIPKKYITDKQQIFIPGRRAAESALNKYVKSSSTYSSTRDYPAKNSTTHLSAYLHFGIIGPNEIATALKGHKNHKDIVRQLLWREFYLYIIWMHHTDYTKQSLTIRANNKIKWQSSGTNLAKWCAGQTGCPLVDAGMRELNLTGYMQNRMRMIVAMYLTFYLRIDWRHGEKYFAQNLTDYDYCNNLGGWLWSTGWEVYSNEYYRVFSMQSQMKRFDPNAEYVKKWVPELKDISPKDIYNWDPKKYPKVKYAKPIIDDLDSARKVGIAMYKNAHNK
jgi:deoxyribodipyrimidine photo-lyase